MAVVAAAALVVGHASAVSADAGDLVNCTQYPTHPACVIQVGGPGGSSDGGGGGGSSACYLPSGEQVPCYIEGLGWFGVASCWWKLATGDYVAYLERRWGKPEPPAAYYEGVCGNPNTGHLSRPTYAVFDTSPGVTLLAEQAVRRLQLPAPQIQLNPAGTAPQVTFVPTWLWIDPVAWGSRSATASAGGLSVTATGVPMRVTWSTGDGQSLTCGPGTPWVSGTEPAAASPDCGHTYATASRSVPGGTFTLTASITWQVTWVGGGRSGTEPVLTSTASVPVLVVESSALTTG